MALGRLISRDPVRRVSVYVDIQPDGTFLFTEVQDVRAFRQPDVRSRKRSSTQDHGQMVAMLPLIVVNRLMREGIWGDEARMKRWLNDPDNRDFRTTGGRV